MSTCCLLLLCSLSTKIYLALRHLTMYYNLALLVKYSEPHPTMFLITACYYNRVSEKKAADTFSQ